MMSFSDERDDCPGLYDHDREPGRNAPTDPLAEALSTWNLASWNATREPESLDLRVDELRAKWAFEDVVRGARR